MKIVILLIIISWAKDLSAASLPCLIELTKQHPEVLKVKEKLMAAKARVIKVRSLPDPEISIGLSKKGMGREKSIMVSQSFPYPGKLSLMAEMEKRQVKMIEQELNELILKKISQLKKDYYELFFINKKIEITNRTKEYLKSIDQSAQTMYATGMIPQTDILRIQEEILMQEEKLIMLSFEKEKGRYQILWQDLGLSKDKEIDITLPDELSKTELMDYERLKALALEKSPMLKMKEFEIEMKQQGVFLAKREFKPDFVSMLEIMDSGDWGIRVGIMYPLYKNKKQKNALIEAERELFSVKQGYEDEKLKLLTMLKEEYLMAQAGDKNIKLYKTGIIPQANLSYTSALANYSVGKIDFLMLLDNLMRLQESELKYYEFLVEYEKACAELEKLTGGGL